MAGIVSSEGSIVTPFLGYRGERRSRKGGFATAIQRACNVYAVAAVELVSKLLIASASVSNTLKTVRSLVS